MRYKERLRAGGIHFFLSLIIVLLFWLIARFFLYPGALSTLGLYDGFIILFFVDLILGPLLTIIVYDVRKKSLKFDLGVIILLQLSAFIFGASLVYTQKPCVMVLSNKGVAIHTMSDCREYGIEPHFRTHIGTVSLVAMDLPASPSEINSIEFVTEFVEGKPLTARSDLYVQIHDLQEGLLDFYLSERKYIKSDDCHILPLISEHADGEACVDIAASRIKKLLD